MNLILYKSSDLKPLSPLEVLGEFAKNRFGKNFPVAVIVHFKFIVSVYQTKTIFARGFWLQIGL